jgi:hypothetical protein
MLAGDVVDSRVSGEGCPTLAGSIGSLLALLQLRVLLEHPPMIFGKYLVVRGERPVRCVRRKCDIVGDRVLGGVPLLG